MRHLLLCTAMLIALTFSLQTIAKAEIEEYAIEKPHTQIIFSVDHLGFSKSYGKFTGHEGHFTFDHEQPENSSLNITIKTASINMDDDTWNTELKSKNFFNAEQFPNMTFESTKIEITGENTANITGNLTLLGITKPVTLKTTHNRSAKHSFSGRYVAGFSATASIKRSDFKMKYGLPLIGDNIQIQLEVEGIRINPADTENVNH